MKLTLLGRLLIAAAILAALYFGFNWLGGANLMEKFKKDNIEAAGSSANTDGSQASSNGTEASATNENTASSSNPNSASSDQASANSEKIPFSFKPLPPVNGRLKGVVELGASGFNSFIVRMDEDKNWSLEKAEYGNSLVMENMATDSDIREGLKKYIGGMLDFGVGGKNIHFVVSSGAQKAEGTQKIINALKSLNYQVNTVTPEREGKLGLKCVLPTDYQGNSFVADIGSGNTKISWKEGSTTSSVETYGAKYFENNTSDDQVHMEVMAKAKQVPASNRKTCFIIGGVPSEMAKTVRNGKERYTVLDAPEAYKMEKAKSKAGVNIYKAIAHATGCKQFVFDWDANFTIGFLLDLP
jgi:Ppx/GppA phosphatase family